VRRPLRVLLLSLELTANLPFALGLAFAQAIPSNQLPAILPAPPSKVLAPPIASGSQYDCPTGYAKPDSVLRVQNLKVCLPIGSAGLTPSGVSINPTGRTAAAKTPSQLAPSAPPATGARNIGSPTLACGGRVGFYACGRNAMECCPVTQDNPCFTGAHACKADASQGGANTMCCLR